jgi:hypothetical protein
MMKAVWDAVTSAFAWLFSLFGLLQPPVAPA